MWSGASQCKIHNKSRISHVVYSTQQLALNEVKVTLKRFTPRSNCCLILDLLIDIKMTFALVPWVFLMNVLKISLLCLMCLTRLIMHEKPSTVSLLRRPPVRGQRKRGEEEVGWGTNARHHGAVPSTSERSVRIILVSCDSFIFYPFYS